MTGVPQLTGGEETEESDRNHDHLDPPAVRRVHHPVPMRLHQEDSADSVSFHFLRTAGCG